MSKLILVFSSAIPYNEPTESGPIVVIFYFIVSVYRRYSMTFQAFQTIIISELRVRLGEQYHFSIHRIMKNNGQILSGLCILLDGQHSAPTIYLDSFFRRYQRGTPLEELVDEIMNIYMENRSLVQQEFSHLFDLDHLRDKIVYRLIHTQSNQKLLEEIPSIPYHDLSIVFYLFLDQNGPVNMTSPVTNQHLTDWHMTPQDLYQLASVNTPRLFPACLRTMDQVMSQLLCQDEDASFDDDLITGILGTPGLTPLYVLTNQTFIHGSCTILYPNILKNFAQLLEQDLIILPSSIHEVLLLPYDGRQNFFELSDMVTHINQTEVPLEEQLSNHIYLYSRETDSVHFVRSCVPSLLS